MTTTLGAVDRWRRHAFGATLLAQVTIAASGALVRLSDSGLAAPPGRAAPTTASHRWGNGCPDRTRPSSSATGWSLVVAATVAAALAAALTHRPRRTDLIVLAARQVVWSARPGWAD